MKSGEYFKEMEEERIMQEWFGAILYWIESRLDSLSDLIVAFVEHDNKITLEFEEVPANNDNTLLVPVEVTHQTSRQN